MKEKIQDLIQELESIVLNSSDDIEQFRLKFLSKKGLINELIAQFRDVDASHKREIGQLLNIVKQNAQSKWELALAQASINTETDHSESIDYSLPSEPDFSGSRHPLSIIENKIISIFKQLGFVLHEGPEIEDDWHNFSALNFPKNHPARDMQDTFFINDDIALRTHTSSVQVRLMEKQKPPIRAIMPGRVYRNEAVSARANCFFHQIPYTLFNENFERGFHQNLIFHQNPLRPPAPRPPAPPVPPPTPAPACHSSHCFQQTLPPPE